MSFVSIPFILLLAVVLLLYYILPLKIRWVMLLIASYIFYAYFNFYLIFLILFTTAISYLSGIIMTKCSSKKVKRLFLILTLVSSLGSLFFFKYFEFLFNSVINLSNLFGAQLEPIALNLILPIGISFYTFQTLSYVLDVYRNKVQPEKHFGYYALFVSFFPQLVAGPIERPENLLPQLKAKHQFNWNNFKEGGAVFLGGFIKKVVIADTLSLFVNSVFNAADKSELLSLSVLVATILFIVQIYCDFSGYSDIAIGCAKMMGIELMQNFNKPFAAKSISDWWTRWHISLSSWFNDYVYKPLAYKSIGKKHLLFRYSVNTMVVMFLMGLWHGANWTFVVWGIGVGFVQIAERLLAKPMKAFYKKTDIGKECRTMRILRKIVLLLFVFFGMMIFRSNSLADFGTLFLKLFTGWQTTGYFTAFLAQTTLAAEYFPVIIMAIGLVYAVNRFISLPRGKVLLGKNSAVARNGQLINMVWLIVLAWIVIMSSGQSYSFIYFQF